jgi:hypothetical protein
MGLIGIPHHRWGGGLPPALQWQHRRDARDRRSEVVVS